MRGTGGSISRPRRRLALVVLTIAAAVLVGAIALISALTDVTIQWGWVVGAVLVVAALIGFFLWIRLADEE